MIVIDSEAESKLVKAAKQLLYNASETGSIIFTLPNDRINPEKLYLVTTSIVQEELDNAECNIYFCEEGDVIILSPVLYGRMANKLALALSKAFDLTTLECNFRFYDLPKDTSRLLALLEPRIEKREKVIKEAKSLQQAQEQARQHSAKREAILGAQISDHTKANISTRRAERKSLEVMMVEDDPFSRRLVGNTLGKDYHLTSLENAESALCTYAQLAPDILFLDINLPNVTGHELLERIMQLDPQAFIIMLSGNSDKENVLQAMQRGAKGFVAKPFTPDKLYHYIRRCATHR